MANVQVKAHFSALAEQGVWASLYDERDYVTAETWSFLIRARRVMELLHGQSRGVRSVLDIGCGTAPLARSLAALGSDYTGIDFSPEMIEGARRNAADLVRQGRARLQVGDATQLPFADGDFDAVIAMGVLEYLSWNQIDQALAEISRVLSPGGVALLTVPKRRHWGLMMNALLSPVGHWARLRPWQRIKLGRQETFDRLLATPGELDAACAKAGLRKVDQRHYNVQLIFRPATLLAPRLSYWLNRPFEALARVPGGRFFATGYIGLYQRSSVGSGRSKRPRDTADRPQLATALRGL
jgi:ubiquinone/menaquinone biosynthesis C-methylase UbiE